MRIEFDPDKDVINRDKHGRSRADSALLEIDTAFIVPDEHRDYQEMRFQAYGLIEGRLHVLAFTVRGDVLRAISLRKANSREEKRYGGKA